MKTAETPHYETIISIVILFVLCGVALAVILPQFNIQRQQAVQSGSGNVENVLSNLKPTGFTPSKLETYNADSLYEKIDGKAPLYTDTGFEKLFTRVFKDNSQDGQNFEIYV